MFCQTKLKTSMNQNFTSQFDNSILFSSTEDDLSKIIYPENGTSLVGLARKLKAFQEFIFTDEDGLKE